MKGMLMLDYVGVLLALIRFSTFIFLIPLLNMKNIPAMAKVGLAGLLAIMVFPDAPSISPDDLSQWFLLILQELAIGLVLAFITSLVFAVIYFDGQLIDVPMGFGMVSVFDPASGTQVPIFSQFFHLLGSLVFFAIDGHLWLFRGLTDSYRLLPAGSFFDGQLLHETIQATAVQLFAIGLKIALPVIGTILLVDVALGIVTRTVPQINVFVLGYPIKIFVGMVILVFVIPMYVSVAALLFGYEGLLFKLFYGLLGAGVN